MKTFKLVMLIVACGLISVSCSNSNEELSIDNTATESELFNKNPGHEGGHGQGGGNGQGGDDEPLSFAVTATFNSDGSISGDNSQIYIDGESYRVNSNIRYGDGVGGGLNGYELSMWGKRQDPGRELKIDLNSPIAPYTASLGVSTSSTFLRVGNMHLLDTMAGGANVRVDDGFVITRANDLNGEDYRIRCGIDPDGNLDSTTSQAVISYNYNDKIWSAEMTTDNCTCSVWRVKKPNDVHEGFYRIPFQLELVAQPQ